MSSFLPIPECQQQEVQAIQQQLCHQPTHMPWPTVDNEPLNEYLTPFLATLAFPTLFPDGKGDPTNPSLHRDVPLAERGTSFKIWRKYRWQVAIPLCQSSKICLLGFEYDPKKTYSAANRNISQTESWRSASDCTRTATNGS